MLDSQSRRLLGGISRLSPTVESFKGNFIKDIRINVVDMCGYNLSAL
jgi:hypothetical protein